MSDTLQEFGRIERFWIERPLVSATLTAMFLGVAGICAELFLFPILNSRPINWGLACGSLLATPLYFIVFYVLFRCLHVLFRRYRGASNDRDRKVDYLFHLNPFLASIFFAPVGGFMVISRDFFALLITGSSIPWGTLVFATIVVMISFVLCYTTARRRQNDAR
ncbi:MAG: hypothetical protein OXH31_06440 [Gammaproteobacteria bacterium]|nr:hypothetical protein [Gammaproteobacteria bacterium]